MTAVVFSFARARLKRALDKLALQLQLPAAEGASHMPFIIKPDEAIETLKRYSADLRYPCESLGCHAKAGEPCVGVPQLKVHQNRRIKRLRAEGRASV